MRFAYRGPIGSVIVVCLLLSSVRAQNKSLTPSTAASDDAALHAVIEELYGGYPKKDLDGVLRLWSAKTPELAAYRQTMQKFFAGFDKIEIKSLAISKLAVEGEKAKLRVELEMSAIEVKTGKPATGLGKMLRALEGVKEEGAWRVWREASAEEDLAAALALLKTDDEQSALLTAEKELVTERLVREITRQANSLRSQGNYPDALARFRFAQKIAEQIGDQAGIAGALNNIGNVHYLQGNFAQAIEHCQKSLRLSEALGDKAEISTALYNIGNVYYSQGNYAQALEQYQKTLTLSEALGDKALTASSLRGIANVRYGQADYAQALEYVQKSLALSEALGDKAGVARSLNGIGVLHSTKGTSSWHWSIYRRAWR